MWRILLQMVFFLDMHCSSDDSEYDTDIDQGQLMELQSPSSPTPPTICKGTHAHGLALVQCFKDAISEGDGPAVLSY